MPRQFRLDLGDPAAGWLAITLTAPPAEPVNLYVSYLTDAPADLLDAVLALLNGAPEARCAWAGEPAEYRWVLRREGDEGRVRLLRFPHFPARLADERGEILLDATCGLRRLATQVRGALRQLKHRMGPAGYEREWGRPFPVEPLLRLEEGLTGAAS